MNTKGIKFLAVLAVLAMAFAVFAVVSDSETNDATDEPTVVTDLDTLREKVAVANFNVKLGNDIEIFESKVSITKNGTLDLNGKTVTFKSLMVAFNVVADAGEVTIKNGKIVNKTVETGNDDTHEIDAITVRSGNTVNLIDLSVEVNTRNGSCVYAFNGATAVNITGGVYENKTVEKYTYKPAWTGLVVNQDSKVSTQMINVNSGTFIGMDPALGDDSGLCTSFLSDKAVAKQDIATNNVKYYEIEEVSSVDEGVTLTLVNDVELTSTFTLKCNLTIPAGKTLSGEGKIVGTGSIDNYGTLYVAKDGSHNVLCAVNLYGGSAWKYADDHYYATSDSSADTVILMDNSSTTKYVSAIQKNNTTGIESATFDIFAPITLKNGGWLSGAEAQTVNVKNGASIDIGAVPATVYANDVLSFENGAKFLGTAKVTVNDKATINYADSSQYYTNTEIKEGGNVVVVGEGGSTPEKVKEFEPTGTTIDVTSFEGADVIVVSKAGLSDVTIPSGKAAVISGVPAATAVLDVSADNSEVTVNTGAAEATYAVKTGGSNTIYLKDVTGSLSFKKGSVEIDISKWTGGEIELDDDAVVKIFGTTEITANLSIVMKNAGKTATLMIEEDKEVTITSTGDFGLTIGEGIDFTVAGKLTANKLTTNDNVTVGSKATLKATAYAANGALKAINVYGTLEGTVTATAKVIAHESSDINGANVTITKLSGKSSNGGTWTIDGAKLTLTNYQGNYNFTQFKEDVTDIILEGENKVTYATKINEIATGTLFGKVNKALTIKTVQGTGSLDVVVDISKTTGDNLVTPMSVFIGNVVKLDTVGLNITVSGSNADWTAAQTKKMEISAIEAATSFTMKDSNAVINVMGSYEAASVIGINVRDKATDTFKPVTISGSTLSVVSAGAATIGSNYTVTGSLIALNGQLFGLVAKDVEDTSISFTNSTVEIAGKCAIINLSTGGISFDGCTAVAVVGKEYAIVQIDAGLPKAIADTVEIRNTLASFSGELFVSDVEITSGANVKVAGELDATKIELSQASELEVKDLVIRDDGSENNGTIVINESATIIGSMTNKATFTNKGVMGIYGTFTNVAPGEFTNDGTFTVFKKELTNFVGTKVFELNEDEHTAATKAKLSMITLDMTKLSLNADGSITVKGATLAFDKDPLFVAKDLGKFDGYITPSQIDDSYMLFLSNGTATVTVTYTVDGAKKTVGDNVIITVSGILVDETDSTKVLYLEANKNDKSLDVKNDTIKDMCAPDSQAALVLTSGKTINNGTATLWSNYVDGDQVAAFNGSKSVYEGSLTSELATITLGGTFGGELISNGAGLTKIAGKMIGDVTAKGDVLISGSIVGDVKVAIKAPLAAKFTVTGKMLGDLVYESSYKAASTDTTDTVATAAMTVGADMTVAAEETPISFEINLAAAANATTTTAGTPGFFTFGTLKAPAAGKNVMLILNQGMIKVPASVTIPERFQVVIEKDSTLEVVKGANMDVKKSALKVSKDAVSHFETGSVAETYGLVACVMSFAIEDGAYMIYSDVAYALTACDEGAELTVTTSADIADNVAVKKGVNVIIADKVTLDFKTFGLAMDEGAKITLMGTGKVVFGQTGEDKTDDADWKFFTVSGTIAYDDDAIVLNEVRFDAAGAEFTGKAATSTEESKISVKLNYSEGTATLTAGNGTGTVALGNNSYPLEKGADDTLVCGVFVIAADTVFDATSITDAFSKVDYKKEAGDKTAKIDKVVLMPTVVTVQGTLNLASSTAVKGVYAGQGVINLAAGKSFSLAISDKVPDATATNKTIPGSVAAKIVDTTDDQNGYVLNLVSPVPGETIAINAISMKIEGVTVDVMTISGNVEVGIITATTSAVVNGLTLQEKSALIGDEVYIVAPSKAVGMLCAKEIHMKESAATSEFSTLDYQVTTADEDYTVYTYFSTIDFDEITDLYVATDVKIEKKLDLSGNDVNIVIADGKKLILEAIMIIGTPATSVGDEGSSIAGKVIINKDDVYLVVYADVDLSEAEIVGADGKTDAVFSKLDVENVPYAAIFAQDGNKIKLSKADATIVPEIIGYNFTAWLNYNGDAQAVIGDTNAYADSAAILVTVMVKYVAGVDYYMNGALFDALNVYTDVPYGSYFTAKISDTSKYQGNPMVNGEKTVYVIDDMEIVASGVTPIPEPPAPEPVVGDSGISLTDILLIVLVILIAIMVVILVLRLNRS